MKTTVCHIAVAHAPFDVRIFHKECVSLAQAGYDVHLIVPHERDEFVQGVHVHAIPLPKSRAAKLLFSPWAALRKALLLHPRPSVYHVHDPELIPFAVVLKHMLGVKVICDFHEDVAGQILTKYWVPRPYRWILSSFVRLFNSLALIGMGIIESDMIEGLYRQPKQSVRNLPLLKRDTIRVRERSDFEKRPSLVYVGSVSEIRGAMTMLELAKKLCSLGIEFDMKIIGQPDRHGLEDQMNRFIVKNDLAENVQFLGPKPYSEAMRAIQNATLGLCLLSPVPNYTYSLSTKILEYMAYGLPVIMSDVPCCRQYVEYCKGGLIVKLDDIGDMAKKIASLLADPDRMLSISRHSQNIVLSELNWQHEAQLLSRFYRRIITGLGSPDRCWYHKPRKQRAKVDIAVT